MDVLIEEAKDLANRGVKELILVAQETQCMVKIFMGKNLCIFY